MQCSRETKTLNAVCGTLVLAAGLVRLLGYRHGGISYNCFICALYTAAGFIWIYQLRRRLIQPDVRRLLVWTAGMFIFLILVRTIKYVFVADGAASARYIWYLYYLPQTFSVLLMFLSVLYIGRPHDYSISRRWRLLYVPATLIVAAVLTNDLHQQAFFFPGGLENWNDNNYVHGPIYYISILWVGLLFLAMLYVTVKRCAVSDARKKLWLPLVPMSLGLCSLLSFLVWRDRGLLWLYKVPELVSIFFVAFVECLILSHLIPSNDSYGSFWTASSLGAGIMDSDGMFHHKSEHVLPVTPEQVRQAEESPVLLENGDVVLQSRAIRGGYGYWTKDVSEINRLNRQLAHTADILTRENAVLDAENALKESRERIRQKSRLYDSIEKSISPQLDALDRLLALPVSDKTAFEHTMKYACVLNAYIKRRSNLLLLSNQTGRVSSGELSLALSESLEYVKLFGIKAHGEYRGERILPAETVLLAYELFQAVLEASIPGADALLVYLNVNDGLSLRVVLNSPRERFDKEAMQDKVNGLHGTVETETEQDTEYVSLLLPLGGESA